MRTKKDRDGDRWSEVAPDVWYSTPPMSLCELEEEFGPLTDVTGEPLDATECRCTGDDHWHDRDLDSEGFCSHCNSTQCRATPTVAGEPLDADMQLADDPEYSKFCEEQDTPRKPEPGDRVRVTYEAVYREQDWDSHHWLERDGLKTFRVPHDVEITVIEPARPAVPENPEAHVIVATDWGSEQFWKYLKSSDVYLLTASHSENGTTVTWRELWDNAVEVGAVIHEAKKLTRYERGPVIGG